MVTVPLVEGMYQARGVIAAAQRCVNLYPEVNQRQTYMYMPQQVTPALVTHYPTPGLTKLGQAPKPGEVRCLYRGNNEKLYGVVGSSAYLINSDWTFQNLGTLATQRGQVKMMDNGRTIVAVDGSQTGYTVDLATSTFGTIVDPAFYGSTSVDYLASFLLFNKPGTQNFYCSLSNQTPTAVVGGQSNYALEALDSLYIAQKSGYGDNLIALASLDKQLWLFGSVTTEIWYVTGGSTSVPFPFAQMPNGLIQHGCAAAYSVAMIADTVIWLSKDLAGKPLVLQSSGYQAVKISTNAIENEMQSYPRTDDAIALVYQQDGHQFYQLTFPSADKTWVFDAAPDVMEWHERAWMDGAGRLHRHRANCAAHVYGVNVVGDFENGAIYNYDINAYTDAGQPIKRIRGYPHLLQDGRRQKYDRFTCDIQCGEAGPGSNDAEIQLRWSDTRGRSWSDPVTQTMGLMGQYLAQPQWRRLGIARDRVFEVSWTNPSLTALNGAFVDMVPSIS